MEGAVEYLLEEVDGLRIRSLHAPQVLSQPHLGEAHVREHDLSDRYVAQGKLPESERGNHHLSNPSQEAESELCDRDASNGKLADRDHTLRDSQASTRITAEGDMHQGIAENSRPELLIDSPAIPNQTSWVWRSAMGTAHSLITDLVPTLSASNQSHWRQMVTRVDGRSETIPVGLIARSDGFVQSGRGWLLQKEQLRAGRQMIYHRETAMTTDQQPYQRILRVCRGLPADSTPVWFMRQAGRYMEEYRRLRERYSLLELCRTPELAAEVTMQPIRRFDLDAAIIFADILLPLGALGVPFHFAKGEGPVLEKPVQEASDVDRLDVADAEERLAFVYQAIELVRSHLEPDVGLIGFAGAPFTVASYLIEGGHSRHFVRTKLFMYEQPEAWHALMTKLSDVTLRYLLRQAKAGAQLVQLFDSWVGILGREDYIRYVMPYSGRILQTLQQSGIPTVHFGTGTGSMLDLMQRAGGTVTGVDWRVDLKDVWALLGDKTVLQGNLDPVVLLGSAGSIREAVLRILEQTHGRPHIFNLGHGILPETPPENVEIAIQQVRKWAETNTGR